MILCYMDESGTPELPGTTSHFVLAGVTIHIEDWKNIDRRMSHLLGAYGLEDAEIHTAWMMRPYHDQKNIAEFNIPDWPKRRQAVRAQRMSMLLKAQRAGDTKKYKQLKKTFKHTEAYIHLTLDERREAVEKVAAMAGSLGFLRLFAECVDKVHFAARGLQTSVEEQAFEQVVTRFQTYLTRVSKEDSQLYGILVHDNNATVAKKHTDMMRRFHTSGTFWRPIDNIVETPFFVDSKLTRMVQVADLFSYALRRYLENGERKLFDLIFPRAERVNQTAVGVRHFSAPSCKCEICAAHRYDAADPPPPA